MKPREITTPLAHPLDGLNVAKTPRRRADGRVALLLDYLSDKIGDLDGSRIENARACWSLILRAEKADPEGDAVDSIKRLIDIATDGNNWHSRNVTNFRYLVNNARRIANDHRARRASGHGAAADKMGELAGRLLGGQ